MRVLKNVPAKSMLSGNRDLDRQWLQGWLQTSNICPVRGRETWQIQNNTRYVELEEPSKSIELVQIGIVSRSSRLERWYNQSQYPRVLYKQFNSFQCTFGSLLTFLEA